MFDKNCFGVNLCKVHTQGWFMQTGYSLNPQEVGDVLVEAARFMTGNTLFPFVVSSSTLTIPESLEVHLYATPVGRPQKMGASVEPHVSAIVGMTFEITHDDMMHALSRWICLRKRQIPYRGMLVKSVKPELPEGSIRFRLSYVPQGSYTDDHPHILGGLA